MANGNGTKLTLWIFAVIIFPVLFFMGNSIIANDKVRQTEDKEIKNCFLLAFKEIQAENKKDFEKIQAEIKQDNKEMSEKVNVLATDIAVIKKEIQK